MTAQNIIVFPTDFSHTGDAALDMASTLAQENDAKLVIVHVEEPPPAYAGGEFYYGLPDPDSDQIQTMLRDVVPKRDVPYEHRLLTGEPASAILRLAKEENAMLIVMSTHGRSGLARLLMGSVAETVVRRAHCPVLTYKAKVKQETPSQ